MPGRRLVEEVKLTLESILPLGVTMLILGPPLVGLVLLAALVGKLWLNIDFNSSVTNFLGTGFLITGVIAVLGWLLRNDKLRENLV